MQSQSGKLDDIHKEVKELKKVVDGIHENVSAERTAKSQKEQQKLALECRDMNKIVLRQVKAIQKLCYLAPFLAREDDMGCFVCSLCLDTLQLQGGKNYSAEVQNGIIHYDFEVGFTLAVANNQWRSETSNTDNGTYRVSEAQTGTAR